MEKEIEKKNIDPLVYFKELKSKKNKWDSKDLQKLYENTESLLKKAYRLGQESVCRKLLFNLEVVQKERELFELGLQTFIYKDDVLEYVEKVSKKVVKLVELKHYPREIPDKISEAIIELKEKKVFDEFIIVYTDYTGETERKVAKNIRRKDPILFGIFKKGMYVVDRLYFIGDWEDEYCDLTLDKMIENMSKKGFSIENKIQKDVNLKDIEMYISELDEKNPLKKSKKKKKPFLKKVSLWQRD